MSAHDRHLAQHSLEAIEVRCLVCGDEWLDSLEREYGQGWLTGREECRVCGGSGADLAIEGTDPADWDPRL